MARNSSINRTKITFNVLIQITTVFLIVVMANYLSFSHFRRWDFSRDGKYALSDQTRRVLHNLKMPVKLIVFFSTGSDIARDVNSLLKEYGYAEKKNVQVEIVDPFLNLTRGREIASKYKLGSNENVIIIDYDGHSKFVNAADMADYEPAFNPADPPRLMAFKGEQTLTTALMQISEQGANKLYVLAGHGEAAIDSPQFSALKTFIVRQNITLVSLRLTDVEVVPPDAKGVLIIGPKYDFSERDLDSLRTFWNKRGRIFVMLDPGSPVPKLAAFLEEQGITVNHDQVLKTVPLKLMSGAVTGVLKEITGDFVEGSAITKRLGNVSATFLGHTQSLTLDRERVKPINIKLQPLIQASKGFWAETNYDTSDGHGIYFDPKRDRATPVVAASVEKGALIDERVQVDSSRMIVIGNSTFVANDALTEADLDFFLGSLNWLLSREQYIGIAPKAVRNFSLSLSDTQIGNIASLTLFAIPGCAAILGLLTWFKRRH